MPRISIIWTTPKEQIQSLVDTSSTLTDILRKLGYTNFEGNQRTLKNRLEYEKIDLTALKERGRLEKLKQLKKLNETGLKPDSEIFIENSTYSRHNLKNKIIENNLIEYKCNCCGNIGEWNGKQLSLHLEHKNGIGNDNRIDNLCFLCPNCHAQTETYGGKNVKIKRKLILTPLQTCPICGNKKDRQAEKCRECYKKILIDK